MYGYFLFSRRVADECYCIICLTKKRDLEVGQGSGTPRIKIAHEEYL